MARYWSVATGEKQVVSRHRDANQTDRRLERSRTSCRDPRHDRVIEAEASKVRSQPASWVQLGADLGEELAGAEVCWNLELVRVAIDHDLIEAPGYRAQCNASIDSSVDLQAARRVVEVEEVPAQLDDGWVEFDPEEGRLRPVLAGEHAHDRAGSQSENEYGPGVAGSRPGCRQQEVVEVETR